jgi:hypothetical protein
MRLAVAVVVVVVVVVLVVVVVIVVAVLIIIIIMSRSVCRQRSRYTLRRYSVRGSNVVSDTAHPDLTLS